MLDWKENQKFFFENKDKYENHQLNWISYLPLHTA